MASKKDKEIIDGEIEARGGRGGFRPGAGRPRGSKNKKTKKSERKYRSIKDRVLRNLDDLISSQLSMAKGQQFLYEIKMHNVGGRRKAKHYLVTDKKTIKQFLDGELDEERYFYVTTKEPDGKMIDSLLDRAFGRATTNQQSDHNFTFEITNYEQIAAEKRELLQENNDTIPVSAEELPAGTYVEPEEVQDSGVAPKVGKIENSFEHPDSKGSK